MTKRKPITKLKHLRPDPNNLNRHTPRGSAMMEDSIRKFGFGDSMTVDRDGVVLSGNQRLETLADIQMDNPIVVQSDGTRPIVHQRTDLSATDPRGVALAIAQNRVGQVNLDWDIQALLALPREQTEACFSEKELEILAGTFTEPAISQQEARKTLAERFVVPPFSVLDARQGYWQDRKRAWLALGIQSEVGRGGGADAGRVTGSDGAGLKLLPQSEQTNKQTNKVLHSQAEHSGTAGSSGTRSIERTATQSMTDGRTDGRSERSKAFKTQGRLNAFQKSRWVVRHDGVTEGEGH